MKQNVRFQEGICPEKIQPDQIKMTSCVALVHTNMHNICQTVVVI